MAQPHYLSSENLRRIQMESNYKFVLVEGETDVPIYESFLRECLAVKDLIGDFQVVDGGGKQQILTFLNRYKANNVRAILDRDFSINLTVQDIRVSVLKKYSIENYIFSKSAAVPIVSSLLNQQESSVDKWLNLDLWAQDSYSKCVRLLMALVYYQNHMHGERKRWIGTVLVYADSRWEIDPKRIDFLLSQLYGENQLPPWKQIIDHFPHRPLTRKKFIDIFPGKMLLISFYRYLKDSSNKIRNGRFGRCISNEQALLIAACKHLVRDSTFRRLMKPILEFVSPKPAD